MLRPVVSFIVPARNEEALLPLCVLSIQRAARAVGIEHEVVVVDDASMDRTASEAERLGARVLRADCRQAAAARNFGAAVARGHLLVFVDADTMIDAFVLERTLQAWHAGVAGGSAGICFDDPVPRWAKLLLPGALWLSRIVGRGWGCYLFATRRAFDSVGGFDETLPTGEAFALSRALRRAGRFLVLPERVLTSGRTLREWHRRQVTHEEAGDRR
jgi:glycosyltransferase involved in cell wall biosynthesis